MMTKEQFERLPKYAKREIERLRMDLREAEAKNERIAKGQTNTYVDKGDFEWDPLDRNAHIRFVLKDRHGHPFNIDVKVMESRSSYIRGEHLQIMAGDSVQVMPQSSNLFCIQPFQH